ncbi:SDR family NAD(P)-dependent oxidoreductase [Novosphingobium pentaromativorans]|uniref:Ketoreductase domain-containing protein n=1 Tax=Novosphingobium pentaromativorans US6-1 TaxID=1088721 RepID=G6EAW0_9SPHN|nr:SDR family NAD(P)-dependent oxidoreductase [Novosphingobium pentaromativorans]AIT80558.1 hypothetical protein JI59_12630 [Novosphingobium pentaromativorans US6-1]EHJ61747.1 hypothetical protein NSU_1508 [Novosphingobium pentaromativorans US6-1]
MSRNTLAGRRIVVTGASSGMGAGVAELFAQEGARLLLLDIAEDALEGVAERTGQVHRVCDVSNDDQVRRAIDSGAEELGGLDGLVNVAGVLVPKPVRQTDFADFSRLVGVNLGGPFLTCRHALPHLEQAQEATIVNVSSLSGIKSQPGMAVYTATKAGLVAFTEALSGELPANVRANAICPGVIRTPMTDFMFTDEAAEQRAASTIAVRRLGTPEDVAQACLYLSTPASGFVSGATLSVSGGHFR